MLREGAHVLAALNTAYGLNFDVSSRSAAVPVGKLEQVHTIHPRLAKSGITGREENISKSLRTLKTRYLNCKHTTNPQIAYRFPA